MKEKLVKLDLNKLRSKDGILRLQNETIETEKLIYENRVSITGTISSPANFIVKRLNQDDEKRSNVQYSYRSRFIKLETNENFSAFPGHVSGYNIIGALFENPLIKDFEINTEKTFNISSLTKHLRNRKPWFADEKEYEDLILRLQSFTAKINGEIKQINDRNGNIEDSYKTTLESNHQNRFNVKMPVFIGQPDQTFKVEIACEARNRTVEFWIESTDLLVLLEKDTKAIIDTQLARFPESFVFIEQ